MQLHEVQSKVAGLRDEWNLLGRVERGDRLRELVALGCSTRGLAAELGIGGRTVCRHLEIAALPEQDRETISRGASAKKVLARKAEQQRRLRVLQRVGLERETGKPSDRLASIVLRFCRGGSGVHKVYAEEVPSFLTSVAAYLSRLGAYGARTPRFPGRSGLAERVEQLRPKNDPDVLWIEHQAEWLARVVWSYTQEQIIWETALRKAERRSTKELE